ncbi:MULTISPECIES: peptidylprolyl isomerase [unclassified Rhizobium]|uniref:peptidylprolyl isomerase n=1 Tax=unclassified Rhizobium TaxID=2613769 RepID=UPI0021F7B48E|nr:MULTISPECIES: peptidylprolyl isomerase [unclassified Rhizobium]MCV9943980.1 peptidylprolyl isomerase [Rhizobium sp. BT-175]MCW0017545.1 peptidylprolyl isomerase [Rhizobium sp. BT-226]
MKFLREPLLHFLVIGAAIFGVFRLADGGKSPASDEIVVSSGQIGSLAAIFSRTWQRPPTAKELDALVNEHIRDEVLYRQGVAMGLDKDDAVVRRRIRQKMEFVAEQAADVEPTDAELQTFVGEHPDWFRSEARVSFDQIYFPAGGVPDADGLNRLLLDLNAGTVEASTVGSELMAGTEFRDVSRSAVAQAFGEEFAVGIDKIAPGGWSGPVTSAYGTHLVRVTARVEAREPPLEDVRGAARREWLHARKVVANEALYQRFRSLYVVKMETTPAGAIEERRAEVVP